MIATIETQALRNKSMVNEVFVRANTGLLYRVRFFA